MFELNSTLKIFLYSQGFKKIKGGLFDSIYVYKKEGLAVQIIKDYNGYKSIGISQSENSEWFDLNIVRWHILKETTFISEKNFEARSIFFINNYFTIVELFNQVNYPLSSKQFSKIEEISAEIRFGKIGG